MDIPQSNCPSKHTWGFLGGQQFNILGKLSDWHQFWFTSADSCMNGHRLFTSRPSISQGAWGWGLGCHKFKSLGTQSNGWTDLHQICHIYADPPGNGYTPNKLPSRHKGALGGGFRGQTFKSMGKLSNGWTDCHHIWHISADPSGNGYTPSRLTLETQGVTWGGV